MQDVLSDSSLESSTSPLKVPPHSIDAEQSVLGGLMLENSAWDEVADKVTEVDFYRHEHKLLFNAIASLAEKNHPFDVVTLSEWLSNRKELEDVGVSRIWVSSPTIAKRRKHRSVR